MRAGSRSLWSAEYTVRLDGRVNIRFTTSLRRPGPLCGWTAPKSQNEIDIFDDDRIRSGAGRLKELHDITSEIMCVSQYSRSTSAVSKLDPFWCWITIL